MVTVHFKMSLLGRVSFKLAEPELWADVLVRCPGNIDSTPDNVIAVRRGSILSPDDMIKENDKIDVFPALSGG